MLTSCSSLPLAPLGLCRSHPLSLMLLYDPKTPLSLSQSSKGEVGLDRKGQGHSREMLMAYRQEWLRDRTCLLTTWIKYCLPNLTTIPNSSQCSNVQHRYYYLCTINRTKKKPSETSQAGWKQLKKRPISSRCQADATFTLQTLSRGRTGRGTTKFPTTKLQGNRLDTQCNQLMTCNEEFSMFQDESRGMWEIRGIITNC